MKTSLKLPPVLRKRGVALILVVSVLALLTILMLAMFTATDNEFKSTQGYVAAQDARRLGDLATNIVISQLQDAAQPNGIGVTDVTKRTIHATQPGAARVYNLDGSFRALYKLYSSRTMQMSNSSAESDFIAPGGGGSSDVPPANWDSLPERYVDLNEPVIRAGTGTNGATDLYFPIVDPTAYQVAITGTLPRSTSQFNVEGFSYSLNGDPVIDGIVKPNGTGPSQLALQRLPMPVEWLYVLQDGSLGALDPTSKKFVKSANGSDASATNPIVGRIAFWTDDESCKININTASEPTFWATPRFFHERDHSWAEKPPQAKEYQRFPGHPATVALSSVLFPDLPGNNSFDFYGKTNASSLPEWQEIQRIYDIVPKIARGGSMMGTQVYASDDQTGYTVADTSKGGVDMTNTMAERLYASLDEMLYAQTLDGSNNRVLNDKWQPVGATGSPTPIASSNNNNSSLLQTLQKSRFFLTANSRSPEFSILGVPKIAMWPISTTNDPLHRTVYDNLIAFCATLQNGGPNSTNTYFFQRGVASNKIQPAHDALSDITLSRNAKLMQYLLALTNVKMPSTTPYTGASAGTATTLLGKYGTDNIHTVLTEIFDYIRTTNLYDDILSVNNPIAGTKPPQVTTALNVTQIYDTAPLQYYTYTNPLIYDVRTTDPAGGTITGAAASALVAENGWPGHGTVTPSLWTDRGKTYRGMGRFITISEVGIHVICCADGDNDANSFKAFGPVCGGRTAAKVDASQTNRWIQDTNGVGGSKQAFWYSNFAPFPDLAIAAQLGVNYTRGDPKYAGNHPAFDPANWNFSLPKAKPLAAGEKMCQALIDLELFCPSEGYTIMHPEWTIVLDGRYMQGITVSGGAVLSGSAKSLFSYNPSVPMMVKSGSSTSSTAGNVYAANGSVSRTGGSADPADIYTARGIAGIDLLPADQNYSLDANADPHAKLANCGLASNFFKVKGPQFGITFPSAGAGLDGKGMQILIYDSHDIQNHPFVQKLDVDFTQGTGGPTVTVPTPSLVTISTEHRKYQSGSSIYDQRVVDAPRWWAFNYDGVIGRYASTGAAITPGSLGTGSYAAAVKPSHTGGSIGRGTGRFQLDGNTTVPSAGNVPGLTAPTGNYPTSPALIAAPASASMIFAPTTQWYTADLAAPSPSGDAAKDFGIDILRTVIPALGDYRLVACRYEVPPAMWVRHRLWDAQGNNPATNATEYYALAHNFCAHDAGDAGFDWNTSATTAVSSSTTVPLQYQFMRALGKINMGAKMPDIPQDDGTAAGGAALNALNSFGDFDNAPGNTRDGAYNNKPDEGNFSSLPYVLVNVGQKIFRSAYFYDAFEMQGDPSSQNGGQLTSYFTPNRMISSPVMFGSLVTSVFDPPAGATPILGTGSGTGQYPTTGAGRPWQTLLFRPHVLPTGDNSASPVAGGAAVHPGAQNPPDHYLLDLFNMPIVEPYAISEPLSEAGKINLNYQIVPFTYIHRATAVYAALKGEMMRCVRTADNNSGINSTASTPIKYKAPPVLASGVTFPPINFWNETTSSIAANNNCYWNRRIDPVETLKQLDERFAMFKDTLLPANRLGLLRSASQICELHMIPANPSPIPVGMFPMPSSASPTTREINMKKFWGAHCLTGDNTREEIYSHLYPKFTTRSNTFRVHVRTQTLKKARSSDPTTFDSTTDKVLGEYRGSYLLERYIDPNPNPKDTANALPDYADGNADPMAKLPLDSFYRFHILEAKRFSP